MIELVPGFRLIGRLYQTPHPVIIADTKIHKIDWHKSRSRGRTENTSQHRSAVTQRRSEADRLIPLSQLNMNVCLVDFHPIACLLVCLKTDNISVFPARQ